jgi:hypothetical protein
MFGKRKTKPLNRPVPTTFSVSFLSDIYSSYRVQAVNGEYCHGYLGAFCTGDVSQDTGSDSTTQWAVMDEQGQVVRRLGPSDTVTI